MRMKTKIIIAFAIWVIAFVAGITAMNLDKRKTVDAKSMIIDEYVLDKETKAQLDENMEILEQFLNNHGTSSSAELDKQYQEIELMGNPNFFKHPVKYHPELLKAWAAVKAVLSIKGYDLAQELLNQAWLNTVPLSPYYPQYSSRVLQSTVFMNKVANETEYKKGDVFDKASTVFERDLHCAINFFDYTKTYVSNGMVRIALEDVYDFKFETDYDDIIAETGNNMMLIAQKAGFLTPFKVYITYTVQGNSFSIFPDGTYIYDAEAGGVFVMAGGAPLYVSNWDNVNGGHPFVTISNAAYQSLPLHPRDGTFVKSYHYPEVYIFAGGAPLYVPTWADYGGEQPYILVDHFALSTHHDTGFFKHARAIEIA
jgi:hypothetical protein